MARYIDADALIRVLEAKADMAMGTPKVVFLSVAKMVDYLPPADVAPRQRIASEIFEELEYHSIDGKISIYSEYFAELKKKYTEANSDE